MSKESRKKRVAALQGGLAAVALAVVAGCGSGNTRPVIVDPAGGLASMPTAPAAAAANTYTGTESLTAWSLYLDDTSATYSYSDASGTIPSASGNFTPSHGFLSLGQENGASLGYILEVPGRLALLRPGDVTAPLVAGVPQTSCYTLPYFLRFDYIAMEAAAGISGDVATAGSDYGSVLASSSNGTSWQYEGLTGTTASGPSSFPGICTTTSGQATLGITGSTFLNTAGPAMPDVISGVETSLTIGPSGIFVANQAGSTANTGADFAVFTGVAGVAEPSAPLQVSNIAAGSYLGFITEAGEAGGALPSSTSPAAFGLLAGSSTLLSGGVYANDDVTQPMSSNTTISLGSQSSTVNGLYPAATITKPDPNQLCYSDHPSGVGTDMNGFPICTFPAIAIVGNPEGKYVLFVNSYDYTAGSLSTAQGTAMQIYLYQR